MDWIDTIKNRALKRIAAGVIAEASQAAVQEAAVGWSQRMREASIAQEKADEESGFRRLSTVGSERLNPIDQDKMSQMCHYLYRTNPLARRMIQIVRDFCSGMSPEAAENASDDAKKVIDGFWNNPHNRMDVFLGDIVERRALDGESLLPVNVNLQDGSVYLGFEDPRGIDKLDLSDNRHVSKVTMKRKVGEAEATTYDIIRYQTDPQAKLKIGESAASNEREVDAYGYRVGTAFYFRDNHLITGRGRPAMEASIDWLDAHDHALFDQFRNVSLTGAFVWDIELDEQSQAKVDERAAKEALKGPPKPGSLNIHNNKEHWSALTPKLDATVAVDLPTEARKIIGLGFGVSETWIAAAQDVNRSTAETADGPPLRHMASLQGDIEWMVRDIVDFVLDMAVLHGALKPDPGNPDWRAFGVQKPDLTSADNAATAKALLDLASGGQMALDMGLCDLESLRNLWYQAAGIPRPQNLDDTIEKAEDDDARQDYTKPDKAEDELLAGTSAAKGKAK